MPAIHPFHYLIAAAVLLTIVLLVYVIRWERGYFAKRGKGRSWRVVRLTSIPMLFATTALILAPSLAISGMEALAVFYLMLLIVGPLFWFGVHWLVGRRTDPPLDFGDTVLIAGSPIAVVVGAAGLANAMAPFAWITMSRFVAM